jgi:proline iminopeptidase
MRISLGDVSVWFDVSGPSVIALGDTTAERPVVVAVHGGPGLDHMTVKSALGPLAISGRQLAHDLLRRVLLPRSHVDVEPSCP